MKSLKSVESQDLDSDSLEVPWRSRAHEFVISLYSDMSGVCVCVCGALQSSMRTS